MVNISKIYIKRITSGCPIALQRFFLISIYIYVLVVYHSDVHLTLYAVNKNAFEMKMK